MTSSPRTRTPGRIDIDMVGRVYRTKKGAANYAADLNRMDSGNTTTWTGQQSEPIHLAFKVVPAEGGFQVERTVVWL